MPWAEATLRQYRRNELRYASNLTDLEWALIRPFMRLRCINLGSVVRDG